MKRVKGIDRIFVIICILILMCSGIGLVPSVTSKDAPVNLLASSPSFKTTIVHKQSELRMESNITDEVNEEIRSKGNPNMIVYLFIVIATVVPIFWKIMITIALRKGIKRQKVITYIHKSDGKKGKGRFLLADEL